MSNDQIRAIVVAIPSTLVFAGLVLAVGRYASPKRQREKSGWAGKIQLRVKVEKGFNLCDPVELPGGRVGWVLIPGTEVAGLNFPESYLIPPIRIKNKNIRSGFPLIHFTWSGVDLVFQNPLMVVSNTYFEVQLLDIIARTMGKYCYYQIMAAKDDDSEFFTGHAEIDD